MKLLISFSLMLLVPVAVIGQTTVEPDYCGSVGDFGECKETFVCEGNSRCSCKDEKPFCRCNSAKDEWFLGGNCEQKWTILTFALVASLPGLALALIVGVTVQMVHYFNKPTNRSEPNKQPQVNRNEEINSQDGAYSNLVFAGDLPSRPKGPFVQPPVQERFPMTPHPSGPYSQQQSGTRPPLDQLPRPAPGIHPYNSLPNGTRASFDRNSMINPGSQPYNIATGMTQPIGSPHGRSPAVRNPYDERAPPAERYDDYRPSQPVSRQNTMMGGYPTPPAPSFSAPDYTSRGQIPRAQIGRPLEAPAGDHRPNSAYY